MAVYTASSLSIHLSLVEGAFIVKPTSMTLNDSFDDAVTRETGTYDVERGPITSTNFAPW